MSARIRDLMQKRAKAVADARAVVDAAEKSGRSIMNAEEQGQYDGFVGDAEKLSDAIEKEERLARLESSVPLETASKRGEKDSDIQSRAFDTFLRRGINSLNGDEQRALQAGSGPDGGFLVPPEQFVNQLLKDLDNSVFLRSKATKFTIEKAESLGVPTLATDINDAEWTAELSTGSEDTALKFGKRNLYPHALAKRVKISNKLVRQSAISIEELVRQRFDYKFGVTQEKAFLLGHGVNQPLGLFFASSDGIPTSRDISAGNSTTAIAFDGLIAAVNALKDGHFRESEWLFHRDARKQLMQIKDLNNQYIWEASVKAGMPDVLYGRPVNISEYVPNTFTTGQYVGMLGAFRHYWIADALSMQMQRLVELYAESNEIGFIGRLETDGMPALAEAFARVTLA